VTYSSAAPHAGTLICAASIIEELGRLADIDCDRADDGAPVPQTPSEAAQVLAALTEQARDALLARRPEQVAREFAFLLRCMVTTTTIEEAIRQYVDFTSCFWSTVCKVEEIGERVFVSTEPSALDKNKVFLHELRACSLMLSALNWLAGDRLADLRAHFSYVPIVEQKIQTIFPHRVCCDRRLTGFSFRRDDLRKPVVSSPTQIEAFVEAAPTVAFEGIARRSYTQRVSTIVDRQLRLRRGIATVADVCGDLGISAPTLHRKLTAEGAAFRRLRDDTVNAAAKELLLTTDAGIATISELLGYSEEAAFRRSFVRWNHCSPAAYRRQALAPEAHANVLGG